MQKRTTEIKLQDKTELELMRHYKEMSDKNFCIEKGFYPLGSCTMKYNPRINEWASKLEGFANLHPHQDDEDCQGALKLMYDLQNFLKIITGMDEICLQPCAGAHGELSGMMVIKRYFEDKGELTTRKKVIIPDNAHGTNPASAAMCGFEILEVKSNEKGLVNVEELKTIVEEYNSQIAAIMMTNPNTLGLFDNNIVEISKIMHDNGSLLYYDGANFNAIMGHTNPKLMGFDVVHLNLHKTFATPHAGGGPGAGPIGVVEKLKDYLPTPKIEFDGEKYFRNSNYPKSIGKVSTFFGNFNVLVKAYTYIYMMGKSLKDVSSDAVLAANYLKSRLKDYYHIAFDTHCAHEFVIDNTDKKELGASTLDIAKRLMDENIHPATIYFPLIVHEAFMVEPTESETKEVLDNFVDVMIKISQEIKDGVDFHEFPKTTPIQRVDEVRAARQPDLKE
ncbi:MAG: aminomethyl-transferring glycine dehydrogenase subunit GcvPB [Candidatus Gastranaerophilales bacterium]|nr:aminomethyl-transferring glycine dehydrogenase subunit GcvPB [Candidatus Gastranaerophilales bacterium]